MKPHVSNLRDVHSQQNPSDKREIFCDDKLKAVMGGKPKITMFNMNKLLTPHLLEKVDRSLYVHEPKAKVKIEDDDEEEEHNHGDDDEADGGDDDEAEEDRTDHLDDDED